MKYINNFLIILSTLWYSTTYCQNNLQIKVVLVDETPATECIILQNIKDNSVIFNSADNQGMFYVELDNIQSITFKNLGYKDITYSKENLIELSDLDKKNNPVITIKLSDLEYMLDEILIELPQKESDTISLRVADINIHENSLLKDILKSNVGFRIEGSEITYKGKTIQKILINKNETFINQNKIALESLEKKMINDVQIINNYTEDFDLTFEKTKETVLNIDMKESYNSTIVPKVDGGYGYNEKYILNNELFYFGKKLNTFLKSSFNNIEEKILDVKELNNDLKNQEFLSEYQTQLLQNNLIQNKNSFYNKNFLNNFIIRRKSEKSRLSFSSYYFNVLRENNLKTFATTFEGNHIYDNDNNYKTKGKSFIGNVFYDYKINQNNIISYQLGTNIHNNKSQIEQKQNILNNGDLLEQNILSNQSNKIYYIINKLNFKTKISEDWILNYQTFFANYNNDNVLMNSLYSNDFSDTKNILNQRINIKHSGYYFLKPELEFFYKKEKENVLDFERKNTFLKSTFKSSGDNILNYISYNLRVSLENIYIKNNNETIRENKLPYHINIQYEKNNNRLEFISNSIFFLNSLYKSTNYFGLENQYFFGTKENIFLVSNTKKHVLKYDYLNLFDMFSFGGEINNINDKNHLGWFMSGISKSGMQQYNLTVIPKNVSFSTSAWISKQIFNMYYPINIQFKYQFLKRKYTMGSLINEVESYKNISNHFNIDIISNSGSPLNFELQSNNEFSSIYRNRNKILTKNNKNIFSIKYTLNNFDTKLFFVFENSFLLDKNYSRKNIGFNISKEFNNWKIGFISENIDEILGLFNNKNFYTKLSANNGINLIQTKDNAIQYLILNIKYQFKIKKQ